MNISGITRQIEIAFWTALVSAMRSPRLGRILVQGLSVFACGLLLWAVIAWVQLPTQAATPVAAGHAPLIEAESALREARPAASPTNGQSNLLLVAVDYLGTRHPELLGVWLVVHTPSLPHASFLPIYPGSGAGAFDARLVESFNLKSDRPLAGEFFEALEAQGLWWNHYLILDTAGLASLVDRTPGLDLGGERFDGRAVSAKLIKAAKDPRGVVDFQAQVAAAVCAFAASETGIPAVSEMVDVLASHARTDLTPADLRQSAREFTAAGHLTCQFPTLAGR